jgi:hypothetical protein
MGKTLWIDAAGLPHRAKTPHLKKVTDLFDRI